MRTDDRNIFTSIDGVVDVNKITHQDGKIDIEFWDGCAWEGVRMRSEDAIAAARVILAHFGEE